MGAVCDSDKNTQNPSVKPPSKILPHSTHLFLFIPLKWFELQVSHCPSSLTK